MSYFFLLFNPVFKMQIKSEKNKRCCEDSPEIKDSYFMNL